MRSAWGSDTALVAFCERMYPRLFGALTLQTGDRALAEDLTQDTLCRVCEQWPRVRSMGRPEGWAFTVAFNLARSGWRRMAAGRRATARLEQEATRRNGSDEHLSDRPWVQAAISDLPPRQRQVVILRYYLDFSVAETATAMHCAPGTVKSLAHRARTTLADILDGRGPAPVRTPLRQVPANPDMPAEAER